MAGWKFQIANLTIQHFHHRPQAQGRNGWAVSAKCKTCRQQGPVRLVASNAIPSNQEIERGEGRKGSRVPLGGASLSRFICQTAAAHSLETTDRCCPPASPHGPEVKSHQTLPAEGAFPRTANRRGRSQAVPSPACAIVGSPATCLQQSQPHGLSSPKRTTSIGSLPLAR